MTGSVIWWPTESEDGLQGFATEQSRDAFAAGGAGPFVRVATPPGGEDRPQLPFRRARTELKGME